MCAMFDVCIFWCFQHFYTPPSYCLSREILYWDFTHYHNILLPHIVFCRVSPPPLPTKTRFLPRKIRHHFLEGSEERSRLIYKKQTFAFRHHFIKLLSVGNKSPLNSIFTFCRTYPFVAFAVTPEKARTHSTTLSAKYHCLTLSPSPSLSLPLIHIA